MAIYAGADLFLMPSKSEPCGLSQMIAMRYGTVPIVRETGGLKDTVQPYEAWRDAGNGFTFANYAGSDMLYVIREAVYLYKDYPDAFARLRRRAMEGDFSWARSAGDYLHIYSSVTGQPWPPVTEEAEPAPAEEAPVPGGACGGGGRPCAGGDLRGARPRPCGRGSPEPAGEGPSAPEAVPAEEPAAPVEEFPAAAPAKAKKPAAKKRTAAGKTSAKTGRKTPAKNRPPPERGLPGSKDPGGVRRRMTPITTKTLEEELTAKLMVSFGKTPEEATDGEMMRACALVLRDKMALREVETPPEGSAGSTHGRSTICPWSS